MPLRSTGRASARVVALGGAASAVVVLTSVGWSGLRDRSVRWPEATAAIAVIGVMALSASLLGPGAAFLRERSTRVQIGIRVAAAFAIGVAWAQLPMLPSALLALAIGQFGGAESALTAEFVGHHRRPFGLWKQFFFSPINLGVLVAIALTVALEGTSGDNGSGISLLVGVETAAIAGAAVHGIVRHLFGVEHRSLEQFASERDDEDHRRRAHWIHDDVCAEIRGLRVKLAMSDMSNAALGAELDELDHRLRTRQLDEIIAGGGASAAEILQLYVRRAQNRGVVISDVPRLDDASIVLHGPTADRFRHAVAGLVSNALNAGATNLAIRLHRDDDRLTLEIADNAGGFDLGSTPAGRGLATLRNEIGADRLRFEPTHDGTLATVVLDLGSAP